VGQAPTLSPVTVSEFTGTSTEEDAP
jgi:hypothetical protein